MDLLPTPDRFTIRCFVLGDPTAEMLAMFGQLLEAGNLNWNLIVIRNDSISSLEGDEAMASDPEGVSDVDWAL